MTRFIKHSRTCCINNELDFLSLLKVPIMSKLPHLCGSSNAAQEEEAKTIPSKNLEGQSHHTYTLTLSLSLSLSLIHTYSRYHTHTHTHNLSHTDTRSNKFTTNSKHLGTEQIPAFSSCTHTWVRILSRQRVFLHGRIFLEGDRML